MISYRPRTVKELGQQWEKISVHVGRAAADCRDRYRNHIQGREQRNSGRILNLRNLDSPQR